MGPRITDITANAAEDAVEDFFSSLIYKRAKAIAEPFIKKYEGEGEVNEAMRQFFQTLSFGLASYALRKIMVFFFERGSKMFLLFWSYIVAGALKSAIAKRLKKSNFKGKKAFKTISAVIGSDRTSERIEVAKMMQRNVDSYDAHKFHYENQRLQSESNLNSFSSSMSDMKNKYDMKAVELMTHYTMTGTWNNSLEHKKVFEKATGRKVSSNGQGSWNSLHQELNKYTEFAKTADGEVMNLTQALKKILARNSMVS